MPKIADISFIVIAYNEENVIDKCLNAIYNLNAEDCEVICVDSGSLDKTIDIMKSYIGKIPNLQILQSTGDRNAAIARNIGIKNCTKKYVFFIDSDVEISKEFLELALNRIEKYNVIQGNLIDYEYEPNFKKLSNKRVRYSINKIKKIANTGGIFFVKSEIIGKTGLFNEGLNYNEDIDYSLRMNRFTDIYFFPLSMGNHHTVPYNNRTKIIDKFRNKHGQFTGYVLRKHFGRKGWIRYCLNYSELFFSITFYLIVLLSVFFQGIFLLVLLFILVDLIKGIVEKKDLLRRFTLHYLDIFFILKGLLFIPKRKYYKILKIH